jgi:hypothetical protein
MYGEELKFFLKNFTSDFSEYFAYEELQVGPDFGQ